MFKSKSVVSTCLPAGVRCQPLGSKKPVSVLPGNRLCVVVLGEATPGAGTFFSCERHIGTRRQEPDKTAAQPWTMDRNQCDISSYPFIGSGQGMMTVYGLVHAMHEPI